MSCAAFLGVCCHVLQVMEVCSTGEEHLVVSYSRRTFSQTGDGHFSPVGGYHKERDLVLILDVARFKCVACCVRQAWRLVPWMMWPGLVRSLLCLPGLEPRALDVVAWFNAWLALCVGFRGTVPCGHLDDEAWHSAWLALRVGFRGTVPCGLSCAVKSACLLAYASTKAFMSAMPMTQEHWGSP